MSSDPFKLPIGERHFFSPCNHSINFLSLSLDNTLDWNHCDHQQHKYHQPPAQMTSPYSTINHLFSIKNFIILSTLFIHSGCQTGTSDNELTLIEEPATDSPPAAAQVYMLGVFHFGGSSGDMAAMNMADPFGQRRQDDIKELVAQLSVIKPTKILVEYPKERQERLNERYNRYLSGEDTLGVNEIYQVGFRLAEQMDHSQLFAIDWNVDLPFDQLVEYCQRHGIMNEFEAFVKDIQTYVAQENKVLDTMSIASYFARTNTDASDQFTNDAYIGKTLSWGDSISEAGVQVATTWWRRNFMILKNIAETIESPDDRILIIIGSGHRAVLKNLIIDRSDMEYVEVGELLK